MRKDTEMITKESVSRNVNLDFLRILACLFVVCCHVATLGLENQTDFTEMWIFSHIFNGIGHTGSILFLFLSGALLLREEYDFKAKKFYFNNFLKLLISYQLWVIIYNVIGVIRRGNYGREYLEDIVINSIAGEGGYHFWYVPVLLGIYLILPMLRAICKSGKGVVAYFVTLFIVIQIIFKGILCFEFKYKYLVQFLFNRIPVTLLNHYVGYFVMGYLLYSLLKENKIKKPALTGGLLFFSGIIVGLLADIYLSVRAGVLLTTFNDIFTVSSCLSAAGMFLWINAKPIVLKEKPMKNVLGIARLTFGIYMIHPLFMEIIIKWWKYTEFLPGIILIPIMVIVLFVISALPIWILSKIPLVDEWLLFCGKRKKDTDK